MPGAYAGSSRSKTPQPTNNFNWNLPQPVPPQSRVGNNVVPHDVQVTPSLFVISVQKAEHATTNEMHLQGKQQLDEP